MRIRELVAPVALVFALSPAAAHTAEEAEPMAPIPPDPYRWLEEIDGDEALDWVRARNAETFERLERHPLYDELLADARAALNAKSRIPSITQRGKHLYNFWKDDEHPRGIYRRTTVEEIGKDEPKWKTVLDIDALAEEEGKPWVFKGMSCLPPEHRHCLVDLSPGGGDAVEVREWDMEELAFVEDGFFLPTAKSSASWIDADTLFVGTDFGEGSLTESGYPRIAKIWKRGTPLAEAEPIFEGDPSSVWAGAYRIRTDAGDIDLVGEQTTFWTAEHYQLLDGELHALDLPPTAVVNDGFLGRLVISLKEPWERGETTFPEGSVLVADPAALRGDDGEVEVLVEQGEGIVIEAVTGTPAGILVTMLDNVRGRLVRFEPAEDGWERREIPFPDNGAIGVTTVDDESGNFFVRYESFLTPPTLYHVAGPDWTPVAVAAQEATFDASGFTVEQYWATSKDGTEVPYFVIMPKDLERNGKNPTHIFSYGGFRNSLTPSYSGSYEELYGAYGSMWLERGGAFVLANIRGGYEFGPAWHAAALRENRVKSYEDFEAVAEDLIERKITSPEHLGIEGRSNGGLLVGATMTRRPDLYGAVVAGVPLLDMRRYHELLAGASWMGEYGDPDDPDDWSFIQGYSPYHNLEEDTDYPAVFFFTSTRDDRVHPGHARKFAAKMIDIGYEVWYYENIEGGHGGSVTNEQLARRLALAYTHLWNQLGRPDAGEPAETE